MKKKGKDVLSFKHGQLTQEAYKHLKNSFIFFAKGEAESKKRDISKEEFELLFRAYLQGANDGVQFAIQSAIAQKESQK